MRAMADPTLHDLLRALDAGGGARPMDELARDLGFADADVAFDRAFEALHDEHPRIDVACPDLVVDTVRLLAHTTLTHRLTAEEAASGRLELGADLTPIEELVDRSVPLAAGGRARVEASIGPLGEPQGHLVGPDGWLGEVAAGELVGFRLAGGRLKVGPAEVTVDLEAAARALAAGAERACETEGHDSAEMGRVVLEALAGDPDRPGAHADDPLAGTLPPLTELVETAGLHRRGVQVFLDVPEGAEVTEPDRRRMGLVMAEALYDLDESEAELLQDLREAHAAVLEGAGRDAAAVDRAARALAVPEVAALFAMESKADAAARAVADAVLAADPPPPARAGGRFVQARAAEARGDHLAAEGLLREALDADPEHPPALLDLAWFAEDRGDARGAISLLQRLPDDAEEDLGRLKGILAAAPSGVGRNDPCPCGSGRKYKQCCARRDGGPLPQRAEWLVWKLVTYLLRGPQRERLRPLVEARGYEPNTFASEPYVDPLVVDVGLFDLGMLDAFLEQRGALLPDDERVLAEEWRASRRALLRLERQRGEVFELTDVATGQPRIARAPGAAALRRGTALLGRVVPTGGAQDLLFWVPLNLGDLDTPPAFVEALGTAGPETLVGAFPIDRPWLRTTDGLPMVACERRYRQPGGADAARGALRATGLTEEADGSFADLAEIAGATRVRGTVTLEEDALVVEASAEARMVDLAARVEAALPDLALLSEHRTPMARAAEDVEHYGLPTEGDAAGRLEPLAALAAFAAGDGVAADPAEVRRAFAAPPAEGTLHGLDLGLLDPADPDERRLLLEAEHPELLDALEAGTEVEGPDGEPMSPELHLAMHEVVAQQLWDDDPPETWETARRLLAEGYDRHEVLHMLASAVSGETWRMLQQGEPFDHDRFVRALAALPGSWEAERPPPPRGRRRLPPGAGRHRPG
jgi:tetratricopeptide (TPR) repeat protein